MDEKDYSEAGRAIRNTMRVSTPMAWIRGLIGAAAGAAMGCFAYFQLLNHGLDSLAIPGALTGLGFGLLSKRSFLSAGFVCAVLGLLVMLWCEWQSLLKFKGENLEGFIKAIPNLNSSSKIMLAIGTAMAFWFGRGR